MMRASSLLIVSIALAGCQDAQPRPVVNHISSDETAAPRSRKPPAAEDRHGQVANRTTAGLRRFDIRVSHAGIKAALITAFLPPSALDSLDAIFATRLDLFATATDGASLSIWLDPFGAIVGAKLDSATATLVAARYDGPLAPHGFYDGRGLSMAGPLLARPVELSFVTSRFGERFDPISGRAREHRGVDYAVPIGTPVFAAGAGLVTARGISAASGKYLRLAHASGFESLYLHLAEFAPGTEVGARVAQHSVVAKSGNSGRSTGPHVHYELHLAGIPLDPQRTMPIPKGALGPLALRQHRAFIEQLQQLRATKPEAQQEEAIR